MSTALEKKHEGFCGNFPKNERDGKNGENPRGVRFKCRQSRRGGGPLANSCTAREIKIKLNYTQ